MNTWWRARFLACPAAVLALVLGQPLGSIAQVTPPNAADAVPAPRSIVTGTIRYRDGKPVARVPVLVYHEHGGLTNSASTDDAGAYEIVDLEPGRYRLRVVLSTSDVTLPGTVVVPKNATKLIRGPNYTATADVRAFGVANGHSFIALNVQPPPQNATGPERVFYATDRLALPAGGFGSDPAFRCSAPVRCPLSFGVVALDKVVGDFAPRTVTAPLDDVETFRSRLLAAAAAMPGQDVVMYIHGCCTTFQTAIEEGALVAREIAPGPVIAYSMPMKPHARVHGLIVPQNYFYDENEVDWSTRHLVAVLDVLVGDGMPRVNVIAHSLGNRLLLGALEQFRVMHERDGKRLGNIVFAAADVDTERFVDAIPTLQKITDHVSVYRSNEDKAVYGSDYVHQVRRLGRLEGGAFAGEAGFDSIDATTFVCNDAGLGRWRPLQLGHFYWKLSSYVRTDIAAALRGVPARDPSRQSALKPVGANGFAWQFKQLPPRDGADCKAAPTKI
jgi:hypothetical protein